MSYSIPLSIVDVPADFPPLGRSDFYQSNNSFTSCDGEPAAPPGLYPQADGSVSTFRQRYTGTYTDGAGATQLWTVGQTVTPSAPALCV